MTRDVCPLMSNYDNKQQCLELDCAWYTEHNPILAEGETKSCQYICAIVLMAYKTSNGEHLIDD